MVTADRTPETAVELLKLDALLDPISLHALLRRVRPTLAVVDVGGDRAMGQVVEVRCVRN